MNIVVALSEVPWDPKTVRLMRSQAEGMLNPSCKHPLEASLRFKDSL